MRSVRLYFDDGSSNASTLSGFTCEYTALPTHPPRCVNAPYIPTRPVSCLNRAGLHTSWTQTKSGDSASIRSAVRSGLSWPSIPYDIWMLYDMIRNAPFVAAGLESGTHRVPCPCSCQNCTGRSSALNASSWLFAQFVVTVWTPRRNASSVSARLSTVHTWNSYPAVLTALISFSVTISGLYMQSMPSAPVSFSPSRRNLGVTGGASLPHHSHA